MPAKTQGGARAKTQAGPRQPRSKYERLLKLQAQLYAIRFLELSRIVCAKDRATVDKAFTAANLEVNSLVPEQIDFDEQRYREKYARQFKELQSAL